MWQEVVASGELTIAQRIDIRMAATFAIGEAKAVADAAWEVAGASAIFASSPLERRFRDIRTLTQQVQGRKSHLQRSAPTFWGWSLLWYSPNGVPMPGAPGARASAGFGFISGRREDNMLSRLIIGAALAARPASCVRACRSAAGWRGGEGRPLA